MKHDQKKEAIRLRVEHQMSFNEIRKAVPVSKGTLSRWLADYQIPDDVKIAKGWNVSLTEEEVSSLKNIFLKAIDDGLTVLQISALTGRSKQSVYHWLERFDLRASPHYTKIIDGDQQLCNGCGSMQQTSLFLNNRCLLCRNKASTDFKREQKSLAVAYKGGKCEVCGYNRSQGALDFHHRDPTQKDFNIARSSKFNERVKRELDKCALLCCRCHREVHDGIIEL